MSTVPFIPPTAPFSPAQREWLNGFLAGMFSQAEAAAPPSVVARDVAVLFASQTGTSERLAKKIAKELKQQGHTARIASLESYAPAALAAEQYAFILASTYGEGDPPDTAVNFYQQLTAEQAPRLDTLHYAVLALGDSHYEHFCKFGADLDERLAALGAKPIAAMVACDVEVDEPFEQWKSGLLARLAEGTETETETETATATAPATPAKAPASQYHRDSPFQAELLEKRALTNDVSSKLTLHLAWSLAGSDLAYEAGDALGVLAQNDPALVGEILEHAHLTGSETVTLSKLGELPLQDALLHKLQITKLSRKLVEAYARAGNCTPLLGLLLPEQQTHLDQYLYDRQLIDLLLEYPGVVASAQQLADLLPRLAPRLYSISSSPRAHAGQVHATVAVVRYRSHNRERGGVCSTLFADRMHVGDTLPVYLQANKKFRIPTDPARPMIMVGPGTGIAPFRAFLHERAALAAPGRNWLFFGERSAATDFLYRDELTQMAESGTLARLDTAFSRDQERKIYVQDRMIEQGAELYAWLEQGAAFYICGDATRMAKDVDAALHQVIATHGGRDADAAQEYVANLHETGRYQRDVY